MNTAPSVAIVGGGWAGCAAAVAAAQGGARVTLVEITHTLGGRARRVDIAHPDGAPMPLDNGQHILIGAYTATLAFMRAVGVEPHEALLATPLTLRFADGQGLAVPPWAARWPAPLDALAAMLTARGWRWADRLALLRRSLRWRARGFACAPADTVAQVCAGLPPRVMDELIEPLCVSALNLPAAQASGAVFLRVLRDALFGRGAPGYAPSALLLPRHDLSALGPEPAAQWLRERGHTVQPGRRIEGIERLDDGGWRLSGEGQTARFDRVVWATHPSAAAQALREIAPTWAQAAAALGHTAITTVYALGPRHHPLAAPMLALRGGPAQFVFDRGQLRAADAGVLAFVLSHSEGEREDLQAATLEQAREQLGLTGLIPLRSITERRATFACTPGLTRPPGAVAPDLWAAGDFIDGPYPATIEGAVRSGQAAGLAAAQRR
ncbi:MAG: NAD(P)-binding protein [Hydrogenophaga sp.]|uniref:hydroxysqualene dehydroxylase HpnE n=1 Tax=Hydrogenophaga sp. TaxID=1904254 RepID=UPI0016AC291F|nr:hydroxysqualene dehydroxylase HpnE [Hydrogenophaga sp.]NIM40798.1 NAD(P)-binding protein [Hydrogenophaga sp.]NIN26273.1 NAD(P)-binding protein [Hydrogenophaga sp.]NIN31138.1 NAD(P)-binding protein [Hydrogenophaga sp.]NIN55181.1 NAD(P)-binding protein [Hydrogenophaga sp.]NIO51224.1 NAD(P)-binding protein [Hydrogenophaga sp.]